MKAKEIVNIYQKMQINGVILYGGGKEGKLAVEVLEEEEIEVKAVADQEVGKLCGCHCCVSLEDLCKFNKEVVCIITPYVPLNEIRDVLSQYYEMVIDNSIIHWIKYFIPENENREFSYYCSFPFNHYESPYISESELKNYGEYNKNDKLLEIDLNVKKQKELISFILQYGQEFTQKLSEGGFRYKIRNTYYNQMDAFVLHSIIRRFVPKKIIEIGSGFSTCVMLDTNEKWLDNITEITCIEPDPTRLLSNIKYEEDNFILKTQFVQDVSLKEFESLEENDMLFIDSSHVAKACGDVLYEYFQILPRLKKGVLIHIHDIFFPFTYSLDWLKKGRGYTEAFLLRALLMDNDNYEIVFFNHMMDEEIRKSLTEFNLSMPEGTSIYLRKR
ncbi:MAG: class I SAM-dependent methyltransferase [Lachnospiraceae bacterium]|nr:class I SAM-dependent methyltransferase [Lachnospiraceae bacterium]